MGRPAWLLRVFPWVVVTVAAAFLSFGGGLLAQDEHSNFRSGATSVEVGAPAVTGSLDELSSRADLDYFSFRARRGALYTIDFDTVTVADAYVNIINSVKRGTSKSAHQTKTQDGNGKMIEWVARTSDTYFVLVEAAPNLDENNPYHLGEYSLQISEDDAMVDRYADDDDNATELAAGDAYQDAISPWTDQPFLTGSVHGGDDLDYFYFSAKRGVRYTIEIEPGTSEGVAITLLKIRSNADDEIVKTNGGVGSTVTWTSPASNKIFVRIGGTNRVRNSQGTYTLRLNSETELQDQHPEQQFEGKEISFSNAYAGAISPADDRDTFKFTSERGVKYILTATLGTAQGVEMSIWDYTGNKRVASNSGVGDMLEWVSPDKDTYYIMVSASTQVPDVIGTYTLTLTVLDTFRDRNDNTWDDATPIILGNPYQGAISPEDDLDFFSFDAERGITYLVRLDSAAGENASVNIMKHSENSDDEVLATNRGGGQQISWTAPDDEGNYYVTVAQASRASNPVGLYTITIEADAALQDRHGDTAASGTQVSIGTSYQGSISPEDDLDYFRFSAQRGITYSVRLDSAAGEDASVAIEDSEGEVLVTNRGGGQQISWTAPSDGDFYVSLAQASQASDPVRIYTITIEADAALQDRHGDTVADGTQVSIGTTYQGSISPEDDLDYFTFAGQRGSGYTITANYVTVDALSLLVNRVEESTSTAARNFGDSNTLTWVPLLSGSQYIEVSSSPRSAIPTGTYTLRVTEDSSTRDRHSDNSKDATRIGLRNEIAGAVSPADDSDFFYFSAEGGKDYRVDLTLGTAEAVRFSVEGAAGIGFTASNFGVGNTLEWTAPVSGGYLLSVSASAQVENPIGTYQMAIRPQGDPRPPDPTPTPTPTPEPAPPAVEDPDKPALVVGSRVAEQGTTAQVTVLLRRIQGVTSLAFKLAYDPSVLRVARVMPGSRLAGATFIHNADTAGQISFGLAATSDPGTDGSVAAVEFEVVGETGDMSPLTLSELEIGLSEGDAPEFPLVGGELRVETPMSGDADGDGAVTARDALIALKVIADASPGYEWLDLNGDGVVNAVDVDQILFLAQPG